MDTNSRTIEMLKETARRVVPAGGKVWLYGSRARGDAREDSDWDLLILVDASSVSSSDEDNIAYPFVYEGWKDGSDISPQIYTFKDWAARSFTSYYKNVERDKILIL